MKGSPSIALSTSKPTSNPYIFVLWGSKFEEAIAAMFTVRLRKAGFHVKIVGLNGTSSTGKHGLTLTTDFTLRKTLSLADQVSCVIVPCSPARLLHLDSDPRLHQFFHKINKNNVKVVICPASHSDINQTDLFQVPIDNTLFCPDSDYLVNFIDELTAILHSETTFLPYRFPQSLLIG